MQISYSILIDDHHASQDCDIDLPEGTTCVAATKQAKEMSSQHYYARCSIRVAAYRGNKALCIWRNENACRRNLS